MNKYLFLIVLLALGLVVAACTTEVEVTREVQVATEAQLVVTPAAPPSADPLDVVQGYMAALNAGNLDTIVGLYADDIVFTIGPFPPRTLSIRSPARPRIWPTMRTPLISVGGFLS